MLSLNAELGKRGASPSLGKHTVHQVTDLGFSSDLSSQSTEHVDVLHPSDFQTTFYYLLGCAVGHAGS